MSLLEANNLSIGYPANGGRKIIAEGIGFRLEGGEFICLLGPNGAGKSTLLRTLAAIQPPLAGSIAICGEDSRTLTPGKKARSLGLVLTERLEMGNLTVRELVALGRAPYTGWLGRLSEDDEGKVSRALNAAGSAPLAGRKVAELSDGERQKAMIARVLAQETPVIILDEPTAHLDLPNRVGIMRLLKNLARETRKVILLSTHELDLALQAADQIWLMEPEGEMKIGAPEDLVLDGTFAACFGKSGFIFDISTGAFRFKEPEGDAVELIGSGPSAFWTRRALERNGFQVGKSFDANRRVRIVEKTSGSRQWQCEANGIPSQHGSVESLIRALQPDNAWYREMNAEKARG
ncbi:MAG TPA: ABC transporter ATP-binding protein [Fibrobacteria bacterium]|nr:ABC transporter ATP-binding protein [Fibrobacteria bacterium]